jgi:hypothetical protein
MNFQVTIMAHKMMAFFIIIIIIIIFWKINIIEKTPGNKDQNSFVFLMGVFPCYCDMQGFYFIFFAFCLFIPTIACMVGFSLYKPM